MNLREEHIPWNIGDERPFQKVRKEGVALPL